MIWIGLDLDFADHLTLVLRPLSGDHHAKTIWSAGEDPTGRTVAKELVITAPCVILRLAPFRFKPARCVNVDILKTIWKWSRTCVKKAGNRTLNPEAVHLALHVTV